MMPNDIETIRSARGLVVRYAEDLERLSNDGFDGSEGDRKLVQMFACMLLTEILLRGPDAWINRDN